MQDKVCKFCSIEKEFSRHKTSQRENPTVTFVTAELGAGGQRGSFVDQVLCFVSY